MTREKFEKLVIEALNSIPENLLKKLENVDIVVQEEPTPYQLKKLKAKKEIIIFGLYEGIPKTKRIGYGEVLPDKITIFKKPIERIACSEEEIKEIVKKTLWHEIGHHFGLDERKIREVERRREKKKLENNKL